MADVEAPSKPIKATEVKPEDLQPKLFFFPGMCVGTRRWLYTWYPGPTLCGHTMHWTEYIFVIFTLVGVVFFIIGTPNIPAIVAAIVLVILSATSLVFVWGFAKYKSLADLAEKLEKIAQANHNEVQALTGINDEWERGMAENEKNADNFTKQMGFVGEECESLDKVREVLQSLVETKKRLQVEEKRLFETTVKARDVTAAEAREKQIHVLKMKASNSFDRIDRRNKYGSGKNDGELEGEEVEKFKAELMKDEFLNTFDWVEYMDKMMEDGKLKKYEALHMLEQATDSYFITMKRAFETEEQLKAKLATLRGEAKKN